MIHIEIIDKMIDIDKMAPQTITGTSTETTDSHHTNSVGPHKIAGIMVLIEITTGVTHHREILTKILDKIGPSTTHRLNKISSIIIANGTVAHGIAECTITKGKITLINHEITFHHKGTIMTKIIITLTTNSPKTQATHTDPL